MNRRGFLQTCLAAAVAPAIPSGFALPAAAPVVVPAAPAAAAAVAGLVFGFRFLPTRDDPLAQRGEPCQGRVGDPGFIPLSDYTTDVNVELENYGRVSPIFKME